MTGKVWSTRLCHRRKGPKQVKARFVVRQFATFLDATFYIATPGLDVTRVLLVMALWKDLLVVVCDITVAFMNTSMPEGETVHVKPPEGLYENNDMVWCLKRALNGLRNAPRLFHEHFADVLTSRRGFARSYTQPACVVFSLQCTSMLYEVVSSMKQYFTMKNTLPLSVRAAQPYRARGTCVKMMSSGSCQLRVMWNACWKNTT